MNSKPWLITKSSHYFILFPNIIYLIPYHTILLFIFSSFLFSPFLFFFFFPFYKEKSCDDTCTNTSILLPVQKPSSHGSTDGSAVWPPRRCRRVSSTSNWPWRTMPTTGSCSLTCPRSLGDSRVWSGSVSLDLLLFVLLYGFDSFFVYNYDYIGWFRFPCRKLVFHCRIACCIGDRHDLAEAFTEGESLKPHNGQSNRWDNRMGMQCCLCT